jgi:transketolase
VDGHDPDALVAALSSPQNGPRAIVARTHKGHGISFMRDRMEWHYLPMSREQYEQALREV